MLAEKRVEVLTSAICRGNARYRVEFLSSFARVPKRSSDERPVHRREGDELARYRDARFARWKVRVVDDDGRVFSERVVVDFDRYFACARVEIEVGAVRRLFIADNTPVQRYEGLDALAEVGCCVVVHTVADKGSLFIRNYPGDAMRITIGGMPVSGKGTASKLLAAELGYDYWGAGTQWREEAEKHGMSLNDFHRYLTEHPDFDRILDERQAALSEQDNIVVDSRLGFHFVKGSVKVYLSVNLDVAAARLLAAKRNEEQVSSLEEARAEIEERMAAERERYKALYGVDAHDTKNYDIVIDTTPLDPKAVVDAITAQLPYS